MRVAAATALGAAAVKAKMLADSEEREAQRQVQVAIDAQMQKVQLKLNSMNQLDEALEKERRTMEVCFTQPAVLCNVSRKDRLAYYCNATYMKTLHHHHHDDFAFTSEQAYAGA